MPTTFHMRIKDIFFFRDGRTVLAGPVEGGEKAIIVSGTATIKMNGETLGTVQIEPEMASRALPQERLEMHAVSTRDPTGLTKEMIEAKQCTLEGTMRFSGHRHLLGIDSPPRDYVADDMTLGPRLPDGWDGDAWIKPDGAGYFLRAWNKAAARYAIAIGAKYEEARKSLLDEIAQGGKKVDIGVAEMTGNRP